MERKYVVKSLVITKDNWKIIEQLAEDVRPETWAKWGFSRALNRIISEWKKAQEQKV